MCGRERSFENGGTLEAGSRNVVAQGGDTPTRVFGKRGCKPLKTKARAAKKRGKRLQEAARASGQRIS